MIQPDPIVRAPVIVIACLRPRYLTVTIWPGVGMLDGGVAEEIPMDVVPFDLRMPNSKFTIVIDRGNGGRIIGVERPEDCRRESEDPVSEM